MARRSSLTGGAALGGVRHDRVLRRLQRRRGLGRGPSRLPAPLPALFSRHPLRGLAAHADEPRGSGGVLDLLHALVHETWPDAPKLVKRPEIGKLIDDAMEAIEKAPSNE